MTPKIIIIRIIARSVLAILLVVALLFALRVLLVELSAGEPNAALIALLGTILGALASALVILANALASNTFHRDQEDRGD